MTAASWPDHLLSSPLPSGMLSPTAYTLVDGNYEYVAGDTAGTVTIPSPVCISLTLDALITR
ncbi:MAG: hypothetical protein ACRDS0_15265 [Pseudonocardiaceae bacterium]